jgi:WD40 repeat protein
VRTWILAGLLVLVVIGGLGFVGLVELVDRTREARRQPQRQEAPIDRGRFVEPALKLEGFPDAVQALAFVPSGERLVTGTKNGNIQIWSLETGKSEATLKRHGTPLHASPSAMTAGGCQPAAGCASASTT